MKKVILSVFLVISTLSVAAQSNANTMFYLAASFGENSFYRFKSLEGEAHYDGKGFFVVSFGYSRNLTNWLSAQIGFDYSHHKIETAPAFLLNNIQNSRIGKIELISFPLSVQADFFKYFFTRAGVMLDTDIENDIGDNQSGLGLFVGVGGKYTFKSGICVFISPFFQKHGLIGFNMDEYSRKLLNAGINAGVGYRF